MILFNYLFSNGDAHLKNFALLETANGDYRLSPAYDLMDTSIHVDEESPFALDDDLFKEWNWSTFRINHPDNVPGKDDFVEFGIKIGVAETRVKKILAPFLQEQPEVLDLINRSFLDNDTKDLYTSHYLERLNILNSN